jgi:hypothetical protein
VKAGTIVTESSTGAIELSDVIQMLQHTAAATVISQLEDVLLVPTALYA